MSNSIVDVIEKYLQTVRLSRSENTYKSYKNAMATFVDVLKEKNIDPSTTSVDTVNEEAIAWMADYLKYYSPATEQLYLVACVRFFEYLMAENLANVNIQRLRLLLRQRARRPGQRLPQFPREEIEEILEYVDQIQTKITDNREIRLREMRDRAFLITLADTGLRVHEACGLRRGDLDWNEGQAIIIGKGNKQAVVRFSSRSLSSLKDYLALRANLDGSTGKSLSSLPLFARHDKGAGMKIKPISTATGRNIVKYYVKLTLGEEAVGSITPHSFRHYFVTTVLRASGNLKLAQELARHASIQVTQRYAHLSNDELDKGYHEIFEKK